MNTFIYPIQSLFLLFCFPVFLLANDCSTATVVNSGSCATLSFDSGCDFGPGSQIQCAGCTGDTWFRWSSGLGSNLTQSNMRFNIELNSAGVVNIMLAYSESIDAVGDPCNWTTIASGTEGYTRYQTQCGVSLSGPGDVYEFDNFGLDGSGTFFIIVEKVSGLASQVSLCPTELSTCSAPANDRCSNATALVAGNGIDPDAASGPNIAAWSDAMKGTISCATKQRLQGYCDSQTEDHYARQAGFGPFNQCYYNGNVGDDPLVGSTFGGDQADSYLENTVWYSFTVPVSSNDWFLHIASSSQCSQEPNQIVAMLFDAANCNNAQATSPNRLYFKKFGLFGVVPTADYSFDGSGSGMTLNAGTTYYLVVDGTRGSQCDFCILVSRGPDDPVLPAELSHFSGANLGADNILYWTTSQEDRHNYFEVERSTDGEYFEAVAQIAGTGSLTHATDYSYTDKHAAIGKNYYRLNMVDQNGMSFYSQIIEITRTVARFELLDLFPNPVDEVLTLRFISPSPIAVKMSLWDMKGQQIRSSSYTGALGEQRIRFWVNGVAPGVYVMKIRQGVFTEVRKVVIE